MNKVIIIVIKLLLFQNGLHTGRPGASHLRVHITRLSSFQIRIILKNS